MKQENGGSKALKTHIMEMAEIDDEILSLLRKRQKEAELLAQVRREVGMDVSDSGEEKAALRRLISRGHPDLPREIVRAVFKEIFSAARSVQEPLTAVYLGPEGSFTHQAAVSLFGKSSSFEPAVGIEDVFSSVEKGECRRGVVPVEKAFEGSFHHTLDLFDRYDVTICGEILLRMRYNLLTNTRELENIEKVYANPMASAQCRAWLKNHLPGVPIHEEESSSSAAQKAAADSKAAALANRLSARIHGLQLMAEDIEDHPDNVTRFISIGKSRATRSGRDKTSIMFTVSHRPGSLYEMLKPLVKRRINMSRIESRPIRTRSWEYLFFVDLDGHEEDHDVSAALKKMEEYSESFRRLGSYPAAESPWP